MTSPRPKVIVHMLSGIDGRLHPERFSNLFDNKSIYEAGACYYTIADSYKPDAILIGRVTVSQSSESKVFDYTKYQPAEKHETFIGKRDTRLLVVFDSKGTILYQSDKVENENVLAVLGESVSEEYLSHLREKGISYIFAGKDGHDYQLALEKLYNEFGMRLVVLEGGGIINGEFLKRRLIDEISVVITPQIDGLSGEPSIFEYKGQKGEKPAEGQSLELIEYKPLNDGIMHLRYKVHKNNQ